MYSQKRNIYAPYGVSFSLFAKMAVYEAACEDFLGFTWKPGTWLNVEGERSSLKCIYIIQGYKTLESDRSKLLKKQLGARSDGGTDYLVSRDNKNRP